MYFVVFRLCYIVGTSHAAWFCTYLGNRSVEIMVPSQHALHQWNYLETVEVVLQGCCLVLAVRSVM